MKVTGDVKQPALLEGSSYPSGGGERLGDTGCYEKDIEAEELDNDYYKESLKQDLPDVRIKRNYHCKWCGHFTQNPREFLYHIKNFHGQKFRIYECPECVYASKHSQKLQRHYKMIHDKKHNTSGRVNRIKKNKTPVSPVKSVKSSSTAKKLYPKTDLHDESSESKTLMEMEDFEKMYNDESPIPPVISRNRSSMKMLNCSRCHFQTKNEVLLKRHELLNHLRKKLFRCKKCNYITGVKARFTKHIKYHDMPMIKCDLCDFTTPYKWNLDRHMKNHLGGGPYRCTKCNFAAEIRQSLTFHIQHHHLKNGEPAVRRYRKKPSYGEITNGDAEFIEDVEFDENSGDGEYAEADYTDVAHSEGDFDLNDCDTMENDLDNPDSTFEVSNLELDSSQDYHMDEPLENEKSAKKPKIVLTLKKTKHSAATAGQAEGIFGEDFIDPDDIVHKNGEVFIKNLKCTKCNYKTAFELDLFKHDQRVHSSKSENLRFSVHGVDGNDQAMLKVSRVQSNNPNSRNENSDNVDVTQDYLGVRIKQEAMEEVDLNDSSNHYDENHTVESTQSLTNLDRNGNLNEDNIDGSTSEPKKTGSLYDDLKQQVAEGGVDNLICNICGHKAKYLSEAMRHRRIEHKQLLPATNRGNRCQYCRRRCKTELDLMNHELVCEAALAAQGENQAVTITGDENVEKDNIAEDPLSHPMENKVFVWNNFKSNSPIASNDKKGSDVDYSSRPESSSSFYNESVGTPDSASIHDDAEESYIIAENDDGSDSKKVKLKKVYKCPNCSFWATTASRFHVHIVGHLNMKPFKCSVCSYKSNWRWDITKHIKLKGNRDGAHVGAQVMMTDDSGERNYEKYEKFLTLMPLEDPSLSCMPNESLSSRTKTKQVTKPILKQEASSPKLQPRSKTLPSLIRHRPVNSIVYKNRPGSFLEKQLGRNVPPPLVRNPNVQSSQFGHYRIPPNNYKNMPGKYPQLPKLTRAPILRRSSDPKISPLVHGGSASNNSFNSSQTYSPSYSRSLEHSVYSNSKNSKSNFYNNGSGRGSMSSLRDGSYDEMPYKKRAMIDGDDCPEPEKTKVFVTDQGVPKRATVWKCKKCSYRRPDKRMVLAHMAKHYSMQNFFLCGFCGFTSNWQSVVRRHCRLKHNGNVSVVENKPKGDEDNSQVDDYDDNNKGDTRKNDGEYKYKMQYECKICPYSCQSRHELDDHMQYHTPRQDAIFKCLFCPYYVNVRKSLDEHVSLHGVNNSKKFFVNVPARTSTREDKLDGNNKFLSHKQKQSNDDDDDVVEVKKFQCPHCPFISSNQCQYLYHKQLHRPQKSSQFKCMYCSYNVSRRNLLLKHLKLHRQKARTSHKQSNGTKITPMSNNLNRNRDDSMDDSRTSLLNDPRKDDVPLVWVSRGNKFFKMYKCHYCPHVNLRKSNIQEHEKMHQSRKMVGEVHNCPLCNYSCSNAGVMAVHMRVHRNKLGKVHGYVDSTRSDAEQLRELNKNAVMGKPSDFTLKQMRQDEAEYNATIDPATGEELKHLYFCPHCPARFLKDTEIDIHKKFHSLRLQFGCEQCNYTARQEAHLMAHMKVHSSEYLEKTIRLLQVHPVSTKYPIPEKVAEDIPAHLHKGKQEPVRAQPLPKPDNYCNVSPAGKEKIHPCTKCPAKFIKLSTLQYHLSLHGSSDSYKCDRPSCDYAVKTVGNLVRHQMMHQQHEAMLKRQAAVNANRAERLSNAAAESSDPYDDLKKMNSKLRRNDDIPMSGVDLLKKKLQYEKECSMKPELIADTSPSRGYTKKDDPARIGNPAFIYPTIMKNGKIKEKRYKCQNCPTALEKRDQYKIHMTLHGADNKYTCEKCRYSVKYYANYLQHIDKHIRFEEIMKHKGTPVENATVARPPDSPMFHDRKHDKSSAATEASVVSAPSPTKTPIVIEPIQEQSLTPAEKQQLILQELKTNLGVPREDNKRVYYCSFCPFSSLKKDHLKSHSQRHRANGAQCLFSCHHCDYTAPQSHFLREHMKCHFRLPKVAFKAEAYFNWEESEIVCHVDTHKSEQSDETDNAVANRKSIEVFKFTQEMRDELVFDELPEDCDVEFIDMASGEPVKQEKDEMEVVQCNNDKS